MGCQCQGFPWDEERQERQDRSTRDVTRLATQQRMFDRDTDGAGHLET